MISYANKSRPIFIFRTCWPRFSWWRRFCFRRVRPQPSSGPPSLLRRMCAITFQPGRAARRRSNSATRWASPRSTSRSFRDGYQAEEATLKAARDFFRQAGLKVSGCVATTEIGKPSTGWQIAVCYTHRQNQERLESIFRFTAALFDEIMIDDFFFTDCECSECAAAKGRLSWQQYREKLMMQMSRERVLGPAHAVNPKVKVIIKFPQWYDRFQQRGYVPDQEAAIFDRIWVGTELRDPASDQWGNKQQYEGYFIYRWLTDIGGPKTGGGWFDPYGTTPVALSRSAADHNSGGRPGGFPLSLRYADMAGISRPCRCPGGAAAPI